VTTLLPKFEIRNPKSETSTKRETRNRIWSVCIRFPAVSNFGLVSDFVLRASCLALPMALFAAGCAQTQPSRFYILRPDTGMAPLAEKAAVSNLPLLAVGPVAVSSHLLQPAIAERTGSSEIRYHTFDRWASPLDEAIGTVLESNLGRLLAGQATIVRRAVVARHDLIVPVLITRFEKDGASGVRIEADWRVIHTESQRVLASGHGGMTQAVLAPGVEAVADALSTGLGALSRDMARDVISALAAIPQSEDAPPSAASRSEGSGPL
jgi:uncharacterized lipoprotein YmbA